MEEGVLVQACIVAATSLIVVGLLVNYDFSLTEAHKCRRVQQVNGLCLKSIWRHHSRCDDNRGMTFACWKATFEKANGDDLDRAQVSQHWAGVIATSWFVLIVDYPPEEWIGVVVIGYLMWHVALLCI